MEQRWHLGQGIRRYVRQYPSRSSVLFSRLVPTEGKNRCCGGSIQSMPHVASHVITSCSLQCRSISNPSRHTALHITFVLFSEALLSPRDAALPAFVLTGNPPGPDPRSHSQQCLSFLSCLSLSYTCCPLVFVFCLLQTMKRMPGMSASAREGDRSSASGRRGDGSTETDGYSSKSVTTTNGIR